MATADNSPSAVSARLKKFINNPFIEDYSLRYAPQHFRRRTSVFGVFLSTLGGISAMFAYAFGANITYAYGFENVLWATIAFGVIFFIITLPICYCIARYNVDMDLLTRGAGFGYIGSTITSLIYAAFTIMFFAFEGSIMAQGLSGYFGISMSLAYAIAALIIIPLATYGIAFLAKFQGWTMPLWLALIALAAYATVTAGGHPIDTWTHFGGDSLSGAAFSLPLMVTLTGTLMSLMTQVGEQADFLRFLPELTRKNRVSWWSALIVGGPATELIIVIPFLLGGFFVSFVAPKTGTSHIDHPVTLFIHAYETIMSPGAALTVATVLVILSQLKINVTNAYSGSLSLSNFFSRVLHRHPGRLVWLVFHILLALALMEFGAFTIMNKILGVFSNVAVAWIGAVFADIVFNKWLFKLSPSYVEFKRAHLYDINPAGFGSMLIASVIALIVYYGAFGSSLVPFAQVVSLGLVIVLTPFIAWVTKGRYYIARGDAYADQRKSGAMAQCVVCGESFETDDMAYCPFHGAPICSLCCTLERDCADVCKRPASKTAGARTATVGLSGLEQPGSMARQRQ